MSQQNSTGLRHFALLFSEREGSSAMIDSLGRHPQIVVPFFESLDHYIIREKVPEAQWPALPAVIGRVLRSGRYASSYFAEAGAEPDEAPTNRHVAFKWRPWGDASRIGPVLAQHGAGAYLLMRRSMLNWCLSLYFTNHVAKQLTDIEIHRHPQFQITSMSAEEREAFLQRLRSEVFS
ncbi:MAG: hypothetical protein IRZ13_19550, partial [Acetobacteraceae bacterium]|nr:hypothetical protein [Acetobacteraceae bacterium]